MTVCVFRPAIRAWSTEPWGERVQVPQATYTRSKCSTQKAASRPSCIPGQKAGPGSPGGGVHTRVPKQTRVCTALPGSCSTSVSERAIGVARPPRAAGEHRLPGKFPRELALLFRIISFPSVPHKNPPAEDGCQPCPGREGGKKAQRKNKHWSSLESPMGIMWEEKAPEGAGPPVQLHRLGTARRPAVTFSRTLGLALPGAGQCGQRAPPALGQCFQ